MTRKYFFKIGDNYKNGTINLYLKPIRIPLILYGLSQQAKFGDNNMDAPSRWNLHASWKHEAWNKQKGRSQLICQKEMIMLTEALLCAQGDDPELRREG